MVRTDGNASVKKTFQPTPFSELPLGSITATGWLKDQLRIQAEGFTGRLPDHWYDVGPESGWLGGPGEDWERGPYYLDGLLPLAYTLEDEELIARTKPWMEWTLGSQRPDGQFGPKSNEDWWSRMIMAKVLAQHAEATGDERVVPFLLKYFRYMLAELDGRPLREWGKARGGETLYVLEWLYRRTGEPFLIDLAVKVHEQTIDWTGIFLDFPYWRPITRFDHRTHVVNVAMGLKEPALYALVSGESKHRDAPKEGIRQLMLYHGQLHGMFSGDEWLAGTHPSQGVELCAVVEYMFTLEQLARINGEGVYGDLLERVSFNALPATISKDWTSRQYVQQVNQIQCSHHERNWTENRGDANMFGLEPNFGCCTANMHQGWPKLASHAWMRTEDGGLAAVAYVPCRVVTTLPDGAELKLHVDTSYPFEETVAIRMELSRESVFPIKLRIPSWCEDPRLEINGAETSFRTEAGYATIAREWKSGDAIVLTLPMKVRAERRANGAVGVVLGPLVFALPIGEVWMKRSGNPPFLNWEVFPDPSTPWNYGLLLQPEDGWATVERGVVGRQPFRADDPPVLIRVRGHRLPEWTVERNSAGELPHSPVPARGQAEALTLVPYAGAKLRIAEFPVVEGIPD